MIDDWKLIGENVSFRYPSASHAVLRNLDFEMLPCQNYLIKGSSGSGKSTLAMILAGHLHPQTGSVYKSNTLLQQRGCPNPIQMVFQNPVVSFNPRRKLGSWFQLLSACTRSQCTALDFHRTLQKLLAEFGVESNLLERFPAEISGGQLQRLSIIVAILARAKLIVLDEPFAFLDKKLAGSVQRILLDCYRNNEFSIVLISHLLPSQDWQFAKTWLITDGTLSLSNGLHDCKRS